MAERSLFDRLAALDTNTESDALDFLGLAGATFGIRPLWNCPKIVGRASTIKLGTKADGQQKAHIITPVIAEIDTDDRVLVITGGTNHARQSPAIAAAAASPSPTCIDSINAPRADCIIASPA